ncbi:MAG: TolC family protein [Akkermansiaceae bacterium]|nr:TolC family protein [Akkermansiaceae bacterium]
MYPFHLFLMLAFAVILLPLQGEPVVIVSLASVGDRIRAQNPDLAAARLRIKEALGRVNQSGRLTNPELETSFEHNPTFREAKLEVGVSQRFPVTNRLLLEKTISITELQAAEAEVREVQRQLVGQARELLVKILATRAHRESVAKQIGVANEFADFLAEAAKKGEAAPLDAGQARLEVRSLALEARQLEVSEATWIGELKPLLGMRLEQAVSVAGKLTDLSLPDRSVDPSRRPDFQAAKLEASAAAQGVALEQARRYEDLEGGFFTAAERSEDAPNGDEKEAIVGVRLKVPLPLWNRNEGSIQEAQAKRTRKEKEAIALSRHIRLEAEAALTEMEQWAKLHGELKQELLPLADEQVNLAETIFRTGQGDIQVVFRAREKRLQLVGKGLDALRDFHLARVRYETVLAKP